MNHGATLTAQGRNGVDAGADTTRERAHQFLSPRLRNTALSPIAMAEEAKPAPGATQDYAATMRDVERIIQTIKTTPDVSALPELVQRGRAQLKECERALDEITTQTAALLPTS